MDITAEINGIKYKAKNTKQLSQFDFNDFDINECPSSCLVKSDKFLFSTSKWVSPKRTRSYPFERVYDTLGFSKRVTVIPVVKDEGSAGDRDFIQWDTVSLMSLIDVYVIFAYYSQADKHPRKCNKITNQKFDNIFVRNKIAEISNYHSSALHWNLKEINEKLSNLIEIANQRYQDISNTTNVQMHNLAGLEKLKNQFLTGVKNFMDTSRDKAKKAQHREKLTLQPKEFLTSKTKATITIKNYLGGLYYLTSDETKIEDNKLYLIESKHSKKSILPNIGDIKDGLLKMILYCNLDNIEANGISYKCQPMLKLTSTLLKHSISTYDSKEKIDTFFKDNKLNLAQQSIIADLLNESKENGFILTVEGSQ